ncbi:XRE family transcriptional regulator [Maricaulis sp.]|uniref:XRE family transcriptional regulator n=1 Tax=Maricaulis sp. TaxID=1486257 RepID=UPI003A934B7F
MLRLARQMRGFGQAAAADLLGIEQPVLSRIENGISEFREELVARAAEQLKFPHGFFYQNEPIYGAPVSVHEPMFRKKSSVAQKNINAVVAETNLRIIHLRRMLEAVDVASSQDFPRLDVEEYGSPEKIAQLLRRHWKLPAGPLKNLTLQCERAGILIMHSHMDGTSVSGLTMNVPGLQPIIVINRSMPADRMRFTLAHELGHLIMHRFPTPQMEKEADAFASELLMPVDDIRPAFVGRKIDLKLLGALKPEWKVSMGSLLMKAKTVGALSTNQATYLWKQMSARGYRLKEPAGLDFEPEKATVLEDLLKVHKDALGYSQEDLLRLFQIHEDDFADFYEGGRRKSVGGAKFTIVR